MYASSSYSRAQTKQQTNIPAMKTRLTKAAAVAFALLGLSATTFSQEFKRSFEGADKQKWEVTETTPGTMTEVPENIVGYLENEGINEYYSEDAGFTKATLEALQKFKDKKRKFYPAEDVHEALHHMQQSIESGYHYNGTLMMEKSDTVYYNVFYKLIDIAVILCGDINHLSDVCSSDHRLGTLDFSPNYEGIFFYSLIYDAGNGKFRAHTLDITDNTPELDHIRKISETENKSTYAITLEETDDIQHFALYIVDIFNDGSIKSYKPVDAETIEAWWTPEANNYEDFEIRYNPKKICWELCYETGEIFKRIEGTKSLCIEIEDGTPVSVLK